MIQCWLNFNSRTKHPLSRVNRLAVHKCTEYVLLLPSSIQVRRAESRFAGALRSFTQHPLMPVIPSLFLLHALLLPPSTTVRPIAAFLAACMYIQDLVSLCMVSYCHVSVSMYSYSTYVGNHSNLSENETLSLSSKL
jgi:hypothetical protein